MGKGRLAPLLIAVAVLGVGLVRTAGATHSATHEAFSGGATFKGLVVKTDDGGISVTATHPSWQTIDSRGFEIPAGDSQLIVTDFFAEVSCFTDSVRCQARVLVGRTLSSALEAEPTDPTSMLRGPALGSQALSRALCVRNAGSSPIDVGVWVQANKTGSLAYTIIGYTMKVARNSPCSPAVNI